MHCTHAADAAIVKHDRQDHACVTLVSHVACMLALNACSACNLLLTGREVATAAEEAAMAPATASTAVSKKRKLESTADASSAVAEGPLQEAPKGQLQGHSQCVSGVVWPDQDSIYSGSWDHSVSPPMLHHIFGTPRLLSQLVMWSSYVAASPYLWLRCVCIHLTAQPSNLSCAESVIQVTNAY